MSRSFDSLTTAERLRQPTSSEPQPHRPRAIFPVARYLPSLRHRMLRGAHRVSHEWEPAGSTLVEPQVEERAYLSETENPAKPPLKRTSDLVISCALILLTLPLMAIVALAIKLDSAGPVAYRQERVGLGCRRFMLLKFRSMRHDAEPDGRPVWAKTDDQRVTRVGRLIRLTRIDELPQLFNVLRGEMSMVGPRPERSYFVDQLSQVIPRFNERHTVKPGITGWAQINYPYGASVEDARNKLTYDLYYKKPQLVYGFKNIGRDGWGYHVRERCEIGLRNCIVQCWQTLSAVFRMNDYVREKLCLTISALLDDGPIQARVSRANEYLIMLKLYELENTEEIRKEFEDIIAEITRDSSANGRIISPIEELTPTQETELIERLLSIYVRESGGNLIF